MKRQFKSAAIMTGLTALLCLIPTGTQSVFAGSQVSVNIHIGPPPPVIVQSRPTMVYLSEPAAYVAVGVPYDIFFVSGRYYYLHGNDWFYGPGYGGPWVYMSYKSLPPGLRKFNVTRLHEFRDREYRGYQAQGPAFKGKHFDADEHKEDQGNNGRGNGNSGNNGKKGK